MSSAIRRSERSASCLCFLMNSPTEGDTDASSLDAAREPSAPARVSSAAPYAADQVASVRFKSQLDLE